MSLVDILTVAFPVIVIAAAFLLRFAPLLRERDDVSDPSKNMSEEEKTEKQENTR